MFCNKDSLSFIIIIIYDFNQPLITKFTNSLHQTKNALHFTGQWICFLCMQRKSIV